MRFAPSPPATATHLRQTLANNLVALRAARGWSQEDLAHIAGVHRTFITQVETQTRNLTLNNLEKLAVALSVPAFELLRPAPALRQESPPSER